MLNELEVLRAACCIAGVDGEISVKERQIVQRLADRVGVGAMSLKAMLEKATTDRSFYEQQLRFLSSDPVEAMRVLLSVAVADGEIEPNERIVLQYFADRLKLPPERYLALLEAAEREVEGKRQQPG